MDKYITEYRGVVLKPCPFCGHNNIGVKEEIIEYRMGQNSPCSALKRVWAYCRYCYAESGKMTIDAVYDSESEAAAIEKWNKRYGEDT